LGAIVIISVIFFVMVSGQLALTGDHEKALSLAALAIFVGAVIACASTISNDSMQDLKAGQMIGATPWKQQVMLVFGVALSAIIIPPVLDVLLNAYGIGNILPRAGMDPEESLAAPQAHLMAAIAQGVFTRNAPWHLLGIGMGVGFFAILLDEYLNSKQKKRLSPLAIGLGVYLPLTSSTALILGGFVAYCVKRTWHAWQAVDTPIAKQLVEKSEHRGLLVSSGLVAGAALMGIALAIPFSIFQTTDALRIMPESYATFAMVAGTLTTIGLLVWMYRVICGFRE